MSAYARAAESTPGLIRKAQGLFALHCRHILDDRRLAGLLAAYGEAIARTARMTGELAVAGICGQCAARDAVCCFAGVERRYDQYLLLINLLLGRVLPPGPEVSGSCFFCGPRGCKLLAKHSFCLNFYCRELRGFLGRPGLSQLMRQVGRELQGQWELDRVLIPWLWARGTEGRAGP